MCCPLTGLFKKDVLFKWGFQEQAAFDGIKLLWLELLAYPTINMALLFI